MSTWNDVNTGDRVELSGRVYLVTKVKPKGDGTAKVSVSAGGSEYRSRVQLRDRVKIIEHAAPTSTAIAAGDPSAKRPPAKAKGPAWGEPADETERMLGNLLQARLVAETSDESAGYYVPPVDVSTVAAHLVMFHGGIPAANMGEGAMMVEHARQHAEAMENTPLAVNHWHTAKRPG